MEGLKLSDFLDEDGLIPVNDCDDLLQWVNGILDDDSDAGLAITAALEDVDCDADPKPSTSSIPDILEIHVDDDEDQILSLNDICNGEAEDKNIPAPIVNEDDLSLIESEEEFGDENDATIAWAVEPKQGTKETKAAAKRRRDRMRRKRNRVRAVMEKKSVRLGSKSTADVEQEKLKREVLSKLQEKRAEWKKQMREELKKKEEEEKKRMMREVEKRDKRVVKRR